MILESKKFGSVDIDEKNGFYGKIDIELGGKPAGCGLSVSEGLAADSKYMEKAARMLDNLDTLDLQARQAVLDDYEADNSGTVGYYVQFHLEELGDDFWQATFPGKPVGEIDAEFIIDNLRLETVGLHTSDGEVSMNLDYVINFDFSDELIAVYFDEEGNITVSHES